MAKIRTVEALDDAISNETAWRKQELTTAKKLVQQSTASAQVTNLRSGVLILYAHWEGWIKNVAQLYIRHVNTQGPAYASLSDAFLGNALKTRFSSVDLASVASVHNDFARFIREDMNDGARLSEDLVQTQSNLSSKVLDDIITRLGLPQRPEYLTRANLIDEELVNRRNSIAHGRHLALEPSDFFALHTNTLELLEIFTDDVRNAATTTAYLVPSQPAPHQSP